MSDVVPPDDPRTVIRDLRQRVKRLHRRVLDPDLLRGQMSLRWPAVRQLAAADAAVARKRAFADASPAYAAAAAAAGAPLPSSRVMTLDGLTWHVPLTEPDNEAMVARALGHQDFPYRVLTQTRDAAIGGVMLDIGANIGRMSIPRVILGDVTVAYCAEPDPLNYACLMRNVRDNGLAGLVLPDHLAIGASEGTVRLQRARSAGGHRVLAEGSASRRETIEVPCLPLDTWVARIGVALEQVRFIKVDVQGSEVDVLRGASHILSHRHIAWQMEIDLDTLAARGYVAGRDLYPIIQQHFTHFIDLNRHRTTARVRPIGVLVEALEYVSGGSDGRTDVVLFSLDPAVSAVFG
ncbi:MAG TPA: FkbM family methyltransferase [Vicinamibacterales bacterium]|jgi:FkbM family methyltransferase|nr:FkbM family methyltransferase [Vicinamibacterales bacterium]